MSETSLLATTFTFVSRQRMRQCDLDVALVMRRLTVQTSTQDYASSSERASYLPNFSLPSLDNSLFILHTQTATGRAGGGVSSLGLETD